MTKFKVGDRVKLNNTCQYIRGPYGFDIGDLGTVTEFVSNYSMMVKMDTNSSKYKDLCVGLSDITHATPPATIQHEGYNYTRGEPVVPEWVKDGAWVINKESGELNQLIAGDPGYFKAVNKKTRHAFVLDFHPSMSVSDVFRPFTNADWKWGMWAEYKGEKVFVCSGKLPFDLIRIDANPDGKVHTTLGSNGYVNIDQITPTTAP